ncbi:MAG: hypothetical protein WC284_08515 [Candidimonas sp.]
MAGKKSSGKTYVSKGERPNVSRKMLNELRRERHKNPSADMLARRLQNRKMILTKGTREQKDALYKKESDYYAALELFEKFSHKGAKWSACVQAVKTNWVASFKAKYADK